MITLLILYLAFCAGVVYFIGSIIPVLFKFSLCVFFILLFIFTLILL